MRSRLRPTTVLADRYPVLGEHQLAMTRRADLDRLGALLGEVEEH